MIGKSIIRPQSRWQTAFTVQVAPISRFDTAPLFGRGERALVRCHNIASLDLADLSEYAAADIGVRWNITCTKFDKGGEFFIVNRHKTTFEDLEWK
ncbi:hypothetical protein [Mycobacterium marinum]|uniref:hypothetical protein n=1 Tax=Mycobacterium marinum TaxID=1781 RepID=UPI001140128B|nr:hypothetical protein [Mycobacterium marinum]MDC8984720.1 hypothetical protein [Mycobacterium marinum]MDC9001958.1 hypothetical protein [Mycobacterium marinum]MDC9012732.1 hypothetical protein [Mycobacterium marinum]MDC9018213.1 hypothetical protein [Mycobacterium marinum]